MMDGGHVSIVPGDRDCIPSRSGYGTAVSAVTPNILGRPFSVSWIRPQSLCASMIGTRRGFFCCDRAERSAQQRGLVRRLELFQELPERFFARFTGGGDRFEIHRRLLDRVRSACSINFPSPGLGRRRPALHHYGVIGYVEGRYHAAGLMSGSSKRKGPAQGGGCDGLDCITRFGS